MNPRRLPRALMAALLVAVALLAPPRPSSADPAAPLEVRIGSVSTPVLNFADPAQVVELSGTLTNTSTTALSNLVVHFWRLPVAITSTRQLDALRADPPIGARITDLTSLAEIAALGPGERAAFTVRAGIAQLTAADDPLPLDGAVYLIGAQVRGSVGDSSGRASLGADTFPIAATRMAVESSAVVSLTARPSWLPDGDFRDSSLAEDLDGRLDTLLASAERPGIQAAIDPALYDAALRMSEPHVVGGEEVEGNGIALRWVRRVDALIAEGRVWRLPYGNPDLMRAEASGVLQQTLANSRTAGAGILDALDDVAILDRATGQVVAQLGEFDTVIVRAATGAEPGPPRILGAVAEDKASSAPDGAELATLLSEDFLSPRPPLYVIDTVRAAEVDAELAAWRTRVAPTATPAEPLAWEQRETAPWPEVAEALSEAGSDAALQGDLTASPAPDQSALGATAWSADFADQQEALSYVQAGSPADIDLGKVTLRAAGSFVMGSRTNTFPVSLTNDLTVPVTLGVAFHSDAPQRIRVPAIDPVTVAPGESLTLDVTPEATANGVALVRAQAVTTGGVAVGRPITIEITATNFGRVGWIIILVSGAVVLGGTAWRIRAVRREQARAAAEENSEPGQ